jgi:hypothetical protein
MVAGTHVRGTEPQPFNCMSRFEQQLLLPSMRGACELTSCNFHLLYRTEAEQRRETSFIMDFKVLSLIVDS